MGPAGPCPRDECHGSAAWTEGGLADGGELEFYERAGAGAKRDPKVAPRWRRTEEVEEWSHYNIHFPTVESRSRSRSRGTRESETWSGRSEICAAHAARPPQS